jgi:hypothetical protein
LNILLSNSLQCNSTYPMKNIGYYLIYLCEFHRRFSVVAGLYFSGDDYVLN